MACINVTALTFSMMSPGLAADAQAEPPRPDPIATDASASSTRPAKENSGETAGATARSGASESTAAPTATTASPAVAPPSETTAAPTPANPRASRLAEAAVQARAHYRRGIDLYASGQYGRALEAFQDAQSLYPSPDFHYNIGQCFEQLARYDQAVLSYRAYLRGKPTAKDRINVENRIERLDALNVRADAAPPRSIAPARAGADAPATGASAPGADVSVTSQSDRPPARARVRDPRRSLFVSGIVVTAVGAPLAIAGGTIFGFQAKRASDGVDAVFEGGNPDRLDYDATRELERAGIRSERLQVTSLVVGSTLALGGIAAILWSRLSKPSRPKSASIRVQPQLGRDGSGLLIQGNF